MMKIDYRDNERAEEKDIYNLYKDVGWKLYTDSFKELLLGIDSSLYVLYAYDGDRLVGLIRVVGDGYTIVYVQDLLILREYQSKGIGSALLNRVFEKYSQVRQKLLLTDRVFKNIKFYEKNGMKDIEKLGAISFMHI